MSKQQNRLTDALDEANSRIEELEAQGNVVAAEFEGDCWKMVKRLLKDCNFDWRDVDGDGVTADAAYEHIKQTIDDLKARHE